MDAELLLRASDTAALALDTLRPSSCQIMSACSSYVPGIAGCSAQRPSPSARYWRKVGSGYRWQQAGRVSCVSAVL